MPVDARLERDTDVRFETVALDDMLAATAGASLRMVILDACRNNPLARSMHGWRTAGTRIMRRRRVTGPPGSAAGIAAVGWFVEVAGAAIRSGCVQPNADCSVSGFAPQRLSCGKDPGLTLRETRRGSDSGHREEPVVATFRTTLRALTLGDWKFCFVTEVMP